MKWILPPGRGARMRAGVALATIAVFAAVSALASGCASSSAAPLPVSLPAPKTGEVTFYLSLPAGPGLQLAGSGIGRLPGRRGKPAPKLEPAAPRRPQAR